jgi:dihydropteroate synthase
LVGVAADAELPVVLMHRRGSPVDMQTAPHYEDAPAEVLAELGEAVERAVQAGIPADRLLLDPGIGFGKRLEDNLALLGALERLTGAGHQTVLGCSRKAMLGALTGRPVDRREHATTATTVLAALAGVDFVRVHDCGAAADALAVVEAVSVASESGRR